MIRAMKMLFAAAPLTLMLTVAPGYAQSYNPPLEIMAGCAAHTQNHFGPFHAGFDYRTGRMVAYGTDAAAEAYFACVRRLSNKH